MNIFKKTCIGTAIFLSTSIALAAPNLTIGTASGKSGDLVTIPVTLENGTNETEASSMLVNINYDSDLLEVKSVDGSELNAKFIADFESSPGVIEMQALVLTMSGLTDSDINIEFMISPDATAGSKAEITLSPVSETSFPSNTKGKAVDSADVSFQNGAVVVE